MTSFAHTERLTPLATAFHYRDELARELCRELARKGRPLTSFVDIPVFMRDVRARLVRRRKLEQLLETLMELDDQLVRDVGLSREDLADAQLLARLAI